MYFIFLFFFQFPHHHSPPPQPSPPLTPDPTPLWFCPCVLYTCSWKPFPLFPPLSSPTSPLVTVSSLIKCFWLYCAWLFVLLIRFHLQVRSYGIFLSPPSLFHLGYCSLVPSMLPQRVGDPSSYWLCSIPLCKCTILFNPLIFWWALRLFPAMVIVNKMGKFSK